MTKCKECGQKSKRKFCLDCIDNHELILHSSGDPFRFGLSHKEKDK